MSSQVIETAFGRFFLRTEQGFLTRVGLTPDLDEGESSPKDKATLELASKEIQEYLAGKRRAFALPFTITGEDHEQELYRFLLNRIPYGVTVSYSYLSTKLALSPSTIGRMLARNPLLLIIPTHRVIHDDGTIGDDAGVLSYELKKHLIELEWRTRKS